jgi:glycine oxidase
MPSSDVVVIGGGIIGTAVAWRCARRGVRVTVVDPDPTRGAWHTAAGMLAPATEAQFTETPLLRLNLAAAQQWPEFAAELEQDSGLPIGFRTCGTLLVAWDGADLADLRRLHTFAISLGVDAHLVDGGELRGLEPALAPGLPGGYLAPGDHQVDPRRLHAALVVAARRRGVTFVESAAALLVDREQVRGVRVEGGRVLATSRVVLAAGAWSGQIAGVPGTDAVPVRPVKGQTLRLRLTGRPRLSRVVRASVKGSPVYLVPRADGGIVVGASSEEAGFDVEPRAGAVYELLRDAQSLVPELGEAVLDEISTGLRPGSPDNAPLIGPADAEGLFVATGHHRNGVLLTPATADAITAMLVDYDFAELVRPFAPQRFRPVDA